MLYPSYYKELLRVCERKKFDLKKVSMDAYDQYPLYRITINPSAKRTFCITAGIHGTEPAGPLGVLNFLQKLNPRKINKKIIIFPLLNPYGFFKNKREDRGNFNLNRHFFEKPQPKAVKKISHLLHKTGADFSLSLHEDDELSCFYIYQYGSNRAFCSSIMNFIGKHAKVCTNAKIYKHKASDGIIQNPVFDGTLDEWLHAEGIPNTACLEIPDSIPFNKRIKLVAQTLEFIATEA